MRRALRRKRQDVTAPNPLPESRRDINLPEELTKLPSGEEFLLFDSGPDDANRILIFGTQRNTDILVRSSSIYVDGTFKIVPELFYQLYTVHAVHPNGAVFPCIYALLPNKTTETYVRLFQKLKELKPDLNPQDVMIDFEKAAMNALERVFPQVHVSGCFYHFSQSVYRKIQSEGLQRMYSTDAEFAIKCRMIAALAFVPQNHVVEAFEELQESSPDELGPIIDYFEDTYIGRKRRRNRAPPMFRHETWNMNERAANELPKTNNKVEGWHRKMVSAVNSCHPNFWHFLEVLKKEQTLSNVVMNQAEAGQEGEKQRLKWRNCAQRIGNLVRDFEINNVLAFLRGIAHNVSM